MNKPLILIVGIALILTGCAASPPVIVDEADTPPDHAPITAEWKQGEEATFTCYEAQTGTTYTIAMPTNPDDPRLADAETARELLGADPVHYLIVDIDATQLMPGETAGMVWKVQWATADHESVTTRDIDTAISEWQVGVDSAAFNASIPLANELRLTEPNRGAKGYEVHVVDEPITSMVEPMVSQSIGAYAPCLR